MTNAITSDKMRYTLEVCMADVLKPVDGLVVKRNAIVGNMDHLRQLKEKYGPHATMGDILEMEKAAQNVAQPVDKRPNIC